MFRFWVQEIIRTPGNPTMIVRCTYFLGCECSDKGVGGWVGQIPNIGFVNLYELLDGP